MATKAQATAAARAIKWWASTSSALAGINTNNTTASRSGSSSTTTSSWGRGMTPTQQAKAVEAIRPINTAYNAGKISAWQATGQAWDQLNTMWGGSKKNTYTPQTDKATSIANAEARVAAEKTPTDIQQPTGESPWPSAWATDNVNTQAWWVSATDISWVATPSWSAKNAQWVVWNPVSPADINASVTQKNNATAANITAQNQALQQKAIWAAEMNAQATAQNIWWSDATLDAKHQVAVVDNAATQAAKNNIKPDPVPITRASNDSPYWNKFGDYAIAQETAHPWYMWDRNQVIANDVVTNNKNIQYMTESDRSKAITDAIVERQWKEIDPKLKTWYDKTVSSINWLIGKDLPVKQAGDYFSMLLNSQDTTWINPTNPYFQSWKRRYNELNWYVNSWIDWITEAVKNDKLLPWDTAWKDLIDKWFWPVLTQAQATKSSETYVQNKLLTDIFWFDPNKSFESQATKLPIFQWLEWQISMKIVQSMAQDQIPSFAKFLLDDKEVQKRRMDGAWTAAEINTLNTQIANFSDDAKESFVSKWWTDANTAFMTSYILEKSKPLVRQLDTLQTQYANQAAMLSIASENARTEYDALIYNRQVKMDTYNYLLWAIDKQEAKKANAAALALAEKQYNEWMAFQREQRNYAKEQANPTVNPGSGNITSYDIWQADLSSPTTAWASAAVQNKKTLVLDENALTQLRNVMADLKSQWTYMIIWETIRDQATQDRYVKEWKSRTNHSKHQDWLAADVYAGKNKDWSFIKPTSQIIQSMNKKWWYQPAETLAKWDYWHFEYRGSTQQNQSSSFIQNIANWSLTTNAQIFNTKNLAANWRQWMQESQIANTIWKQLISSQLTPKSSLSEINDILDKASSPSIVWADDKTVLNTLQESVWIEKTLQFYNQYSDWYQTVWSLSNWDMSVEQKKTNSWIASQRKKLVYKNWWTKLQLKQLLETYLVSIPENLLSDIYN